VSVKAYKWSSLAMALVVIAVYQLSFRTKIVTDPSSFIPSTSSERQQILLQEIKQGANGRVWLLSIENEAPHALAAQNRKLATKLRKADVFANVVNGPGQADETALARIMRHRYLLSEPPSFTSQQLHEALLARIQDLRSPMSTFSKDMIARDPVGKIMELQTRLGKQSGGTVSYQGVWFSKDKKRTFLVAETRASGLDLDAQEEVRQLVIDSFRLLEADSTASLTLSGAPVIALATRDRIRGDSQRFSVIASFIVLIILFTAYRRVSVTVFSVIPLGIAMILATGMVSVIFGNVHGITLAFGITLLGVAVDYPVHLLSHRNSQEDLLHAAQKIWPVIRIGAITTGLGYLSMLFAGFDGLVQLGVFSVTGIVVSVLTTRYLLPELDRFVSGATGWKPRALERLASMHIAGGRLLAVVLAAICIVVLTSAERVMSDDLSEISPIPAELARRDHQLREQLGLSEPRYVVFIKGRDIESVLQKQERVVPVLQTLTKSGELASFDAASRILPSARTQTQRQQQLPDRATLKQRMQRALVGTPFKAGTFDAFIADVEHSRTLKPMLIEDLSGTAIGLSLESMLHQRADYALGVITLGGVSAPLRIVDAVDALGDSNIWFVDLKQATGQHVRDFSRGMLKSIGLALGVILLVLVVSLRDIRRVANVVLPVGAAVLVAAAVPLIMGGTLNLFHLVSLLLVAGLGVDYALFFTQPWQNEEDRLGTFHSVVVCSLSTIGVFATLSVSDVPVLHSIGITVSVGALSSFLLSWASSRKIS